MYGTGSATLRGGHSAFEGLRVPYPVAVEGTMPLRDGGYCSLVLWCSITSPRAVVEGTVPCIAVEEF